MGLERQFGARRDMPSPLRSVLTFHRPHENLGVSTVTVTYPLVKGGQMPEGQALLEGSVSSFVLVEIRFFQTITRKAFQGPMHRRLWGGKMVCLQGNRSCPLGF